MTEKLLLMLFGITKPDSEAAKEAVQGYQETVDSFWPKALEQYLKENPDQQGVTGIIRAAMEYKGGDQDTSNIDEPDYKLSPEQVQRLFEINEHFIDEYNQLLIDTQTMDMPEEKLDEIIAYLEELKTQNQNNQGKWKQMLQGFVQDSPASSSVSESSKGVDIPERNSVTTAPGTPDALADQWFSDASRMHNASQKQSEVNGVSPTLNLGGVMTGNPNTETNSAPAQN